MTKHISSLNENITPDSQVACLCSKPSSAADFKGSDIAGTSIYCDETGGESFDYHDLGEGEHEMLGVAIGNVSGHGISAALLMATVRAALRQRVSLRGNLKDIISDSKTETSGHTILTFNTLCPNRRLSNSRSEQLQGMANLIAGHVE
jgi:hypothetical protein